MGRKGISHFLGFSYFLSLWPLSDALPTQRVYLTSWESDMFVVCSGTAGTNSTDSTFNFDSL